MFRRHWFALPPDASFPSSLKDLGYFVNDEDEIRSIENPDYYFKFFLNKNERINKRQRFEFDRAVEGIIHDRLINGGLKKIRLPLQAKPSDPHVPIYTSNDISSKTRVVLIFGEHTKALGVLAHRVASGPGGINKGTMVSAVQAINNLPTGDKDGQPLAIILANMGQLYWWHEGKEAITVDASSAIPLPSLVHKGTKYIPKVNDIPENEDPDKHMTSIFRDVVAEYTKYGARLDIVVIGESCGTFARFFNDQQNWSSWGPFLGAILFFSPSLIEDAFTNENLKAFVAKRARGYIVSDEPLGTPLFGPEGNPSGGIQPYGFPCYSSGEQMLAELVFIKALHDGLSYLQDAALNPDFENPPVTAIERPTIQETEDAWAELVEKERPSMAQCDEDVLMKEVRMLRRWRKFEQTGEAPDSDSYSDTDEF